MREARGLGLAAAFLAAVALHLCALWLLAAWRGQEPPSPPGDQHITIDLAPEMVEAPSVEPVETSRPAGAPAESASVEPPSDAPAPEPPPPAAAVSPSPEVPAIASTAFEEAPMPPEERAIASTAIEAVPMPPEERQPPQAVVRVEPAPPLAVAPSAARTLPVRRPEPVRRTVRRPAPPGAAGTTQREAARGATSRDESRGAAAAAVDPSALSRYAAVLAAALKARLRYPDAARAAGANGVAMLRFTMHRSGRILSASIARSAGHPALDQAALATAAPGSSLPAAPETIPQQQFSIAVPLRFDFR